MSTDKKDKNPNVPTLRFPGFTDEWQSESLSEYFTFKNGLNPDAKRIGKGVKFISVMDILSNEFITNSNIRNSVEASTEEMSVFGVHYGDILFQRSSETLEDVGRANVYLDNEIAVYGGFVIRGRAIKEYNPIFMRYALAAPCNRKKIIVKGAGAQHFNIGQDGLSKVNISFPKITEQKKIGKLMSLIDERIATQSKIIERLESLIGGIVENLYCGNDCMPLGDLIKSVSVRNKRGEDLPVLSVSNKSGFIAQTEQFEERVIASDDTSNYKVVVKDDFAFNPARINIGSIARLKSYESGVISPMYVCFRVIETVLPEYVEYFLKTKRFADDVEKRLEGSVRRCLTFDALCEIDIPFVGIDSQKAITEHIALLHSKLEIERSFVANLKKQKDYLLASMFI